MKGILLMSHGKMAEGLLDTLKMFNGEIEQIKTLCLMPGQDMAEFLANIQQAAKEVDTGDGVVAFCDLLFGTPCNCSSRLIMDESLKDKLDIITGMNLPMVMEYLGMRESGMSAEQILDAGKNGIVDFVKMYKSTHE